MSGSKRLILWIALLCALPTGAYCIAFTWNAAPADVNWTNPNNWTPNTNYPGDTPGRFDDVTIGGAPTLQPTLNASLNEVLQSVSLTDGITLTVGATFIARTFSMAAGVGSPTLASTGAFSITIEDGLSITAGAVAANLIFKMDGTFGVSPHSLSTTASLGNLRVIAAGQTIQLGAVLNLSADLQVTSGTLDLNGHNLVDSGTASFGATVSNGGAAANLSVTAGATLTNTASISTNGGSITFSSTLGSPGTAYALTLNKGAGTLTFDGLVGSGGSPLLSLTTDALGSCVINTTGVTTTGLQSYGGPVTLSANAVFTTSNSAVTFSSTVNGNAANTQDMTVSAGSGLITLGGVVGGGQSLKSLSLTSTAVAANAITIQSVTTGGGGTQSYTGNVTIGASATLTSNGNNVGFTAPVNGAAGNTQDLTVTAGAGTVSFGGAVGGSTTLRSLAVTSTTSITIQNVTTGGGGVQSYTGPVIIGATATLTSNGNNVSFSAAVNGAAANTEDLTVAAGAGTVSFGGAVGAGTTLRSLAVTSTTSITIQNVTTGGGGVQSYTGNVILGANASLVSTGNNVSFSASINGSGANTQDFSVNAGAGTITLGGDAGTGTSLKSLTLISTNLGAAAITIRNVTTGGAGVQSYQGNVTLGAAALLASNGNNISFTQTVNGAQAFQLTAGAGTITFTGIVGGGTALTSLTVNSTSLFSNAASVTVAGAGAISITADDASLGGAVATTSGAITIQPVSAGQAIRLSDIAGGVNLSAAELGQLSTTGLVTIGSAAGTGPIGIGAGGPINLGAKTFDMLIRSLSGSVTFTSSLGSVLTPGAGHNLSFTLGTGTVSHAAGANPDIVLSGLGILAFTSGAVGTAGTPLPVNIPTLGTTTLSGALYLANASGTSLTVGAAVSTLGNAVQISSTGAASLTVNAGITSTAGGITLVSGTLGLSVAAGQTVDAGTGTITINGGTGPISLNATSTLKTTNGTVAALLIRNATTVGLGIINASAAGAITTIGSGADVTGAVTQNGAVTLTTLTGSTAGTVTLTLGNIIPTLGAFTCSGAFSLTTTGALAVTGSVTSAGGDIRLNATGITINSAGVALNAGAGNVTLNPSANGVTQTAGTITAAGLRLLGVGTGISPFAVTQLGNSIGTFAAATSGGAVSLTTSAGVTVGTVLATAGVATTNQTLTITAAGLVAVNNAVATGAANVTITATGAVTQTAQMTGTTLTVKTLNAVGAAITLNVATNHFTTIDLACRNAGDTLNVNANIVYYDSGAFAVGGVGGIRTLGNASLQNGGNVTQGVIITASGLELLGSGSYAFGALANAVTTLAGNVANNIAFQSSGALGIGTVNTVGLTTTAAGTISLTVGGALTQTQALVAAGLLTITAGANPATLNLAANSLSSVSVVSGAAVSLNSQNAYTITGATVTGLFTAVTNTAGAISVTGVINASGGAGDVTLTPVGNIILNYALSAVITTAAGNIQLQSPVTLSAVTALTTTGGSITFSQAVDGGQPLTLTATALGGVTFNGAVGGGTNLTSLTVSSASLFTNAAAAPITVAAAGAISITANDVSIAAAITTTSGSITIKAVTALQPIFINNAGAGLSISAVELAFLNTSGTVTIGAAVTGTGAMTIGGAGPIPLGAKGWAGLNLAGLSSNVVFNFAVADTLTLPNNTTFSTTIGTGVVSSPGPATADVTIGGLTGTVRFVSGGAVTMTAAAAQLGASTTTGAINYTTTGTVTVVGAVSCGGTSIRLNATGITLNSAGVVLNAGVGNVTLNPSTVSGVTQTLGTITAAGLELLGTGPISLGAALNAVGTVAGNVAGKISLQTAGALAVGTVNTVGLTTTAAGTITLNVPAAVTQTQAVTAAGGLELLGSGPYNLGTSLNAVTLVAGNVAGNIILRTSGALSVGSVNTVGLTTTAAGTITLNAPAAVTQTQLITAAGGLELLGSGPYNLGTSLNAVTLVAGNVAGNITLRTAGALAVGTVNTVGLTTTAAGTITLNIPAAVTQTQIITAAGGLELLGSGPYTLGALLNAVTLVAGNVAGNIALRTSGVLSVGTVNTVGLTTTAAGTITLNAPAAVTQTQIITAAGGLELLGSGPYNLGALLNAVTTVAGTVAGNIVLRTAGVLSVGTVNTVGLTTTGAGNVTLNVPAAVSQTQIITAAGGLEMLGSGPYNLGGLANAVTLVAGNVAGNITLRTAGALSVGTVNTVGLTTTAGGTITLSIPAAVTQTQAVTAPGGLELLGTGPYNLGTSLNAVGTVAGNVAGNIILRTSGALSVGTVNTVGLTTTAAGTITLNAPAAVTQTQLITAAGGLELLGSGPYTLGVLLNAVTLVAGNVAGNITLRTAGALAVGTVNTVGLTTTAAGTITLNIPAAVTQTQIITAAGGLELLGSGPYTLGVLLNAVTTVAGNVAGDIALRTAGALSVGTVNTVGLTTTAAGTISFTVGGNLTQTQKLVPAGLLTITAAASSVTLNLAANSLSSVSVVSGAAVSLNSQNAYTITGAAVTGLFTAITNTAGTITLTGLVSSTGGGVTLTPVGNIILNFGGGSVITTTAGAIQLQSPVTLQANTILSTTGGLISFSGAVDGGFSLTLSATTGAVTFNGAVGGFTPLSGLTVNSTSLFTNTAAAPITVNGAGVIFITADDVSLSAAVATTSGPITIQPVTANRNILLHNAGAGLSISAAELAQLSTIGTVTIGAAGTGTGTISIGQAGPIPLGGETWAGLSLAGLSSNVLFNLTGANTLTLPNNATFSTTIGTGAVINLGGATADVTIGGATGTVRFIAAGLVSVTGAAAQLGASTTTGTILYTTTGGMAVVGAVSSTGNPITLDAGLGQAFSSAAAGTISAGVSTVQITSRTISLGANVSAAGGITLRPDAITTTIGLNDASGTFNVTSASLGFLVTTGTVTIGRVGAGTATMSIGGAGPIALGGLTWAGLSLVGASSNVQFTFPLVANTMTLPGNATFTLAIGTGTVTNPSGATADVTIGGLGTVTITSAGAVTMTASVAQLGASATTGALTFTDTAALTVIGGVSSGNNPLSLTGAGFALNAGITVDSGSATMIINGGGAAINLGTGILTTTNNTAAALTIHNATTVTLGSVSAAAGTVVLGVGGDVTGLVSQSGALIINASVLTVNTTGALNLTNANTIPSLGPVTHGGAFTLTDAVGLTLTANIQPSASSVSITTTAGALVIGGNNITTTGANDILLQGAGGVTQAAGSTIDAGAGTITIDGGGQSLNFTTGTLVTTNATATAITIRNATVAVALGNITALSGTLNLGTALLPLSVAITQNGTINVSGLSIAGGAITLPAGINLTGSLTVVSGTVTLGSSITVGGNITILAAGVLDVSSASRDITLSGSWSSVNVGNFVAHSGTVTLTPAAPITVSGDNQFFKLACAVAGATIRFQVASTQTILPGGNFSMNGLSGSNIVLNSTTGAALWNFNLDVTASLSMQWVDVFWSNAIIPIIIPANVNAGPTPPTIYNDINWLNVMYVTATVTQDINSNGKIGRLLVTVPAAINDIFTGFTATVPGYTVTGYADVGSFTNQFYVILKEGTMLDTGATPAWTLTNSSLLDAATSSKLVLIQVPPFVSGDSARPVLGYTLGVAGRDQVFVAFSEPVFRAPGVALLPGDFSFTTGSLPALSVVAITPITAVGNGITEAVLTLDRTLLPEDFLTPTMMHVLGTTQDLAGNLIIIPALGHRISDLGLGLLGNSLYEPVWAKDETIGAATPGLGYINVFDGTTWLGNRQNITIEGHLQTLLTQPLLQPAPGTTSLVFDVDVPSSLKSASGLWLPGFTDDTSVVGGFSGLVPTGATGDPSAQTAAELAPTAGQLRDFQIPRGTAKEKDGAVVNFLFNIGGGLNLNTARVIDPSAPDWYRHVTPWALVLHDISPQRGGVQILNNVINPDRGEKVTLNFSQSKSGQVTVTVFDLSGSIVNVILRTSQGPGSYAVTWDGRNRGGRTVARGLYFIKIVSPDADEIRKVLVVR